MISAVSSHNLLVWIMQVFMITSAGALLPVVFRLHHPRSNLVYYRLLLMAALLLPLLQPLEHEIVVVGDAQSSVHVPTQVATEPTAPWHSIVDRWPEAILAIFLGGMVVRLAWLAGGFWQLRRLRKSSTLLQPLPPPVQRACTAVKTNAVFRVSDGIKGPVTFGFLRPLILLPKSFLEMTDESQNSVACHELLHVRRKDWPLTILEEVLASFLWFQPAVWWIVAQTRLVREQVVDAAVVSLSASRDSYIQTLFSLADARLEADLGVASLFLRRRHLIHRVHSLLTEVSMSRTRLLSSYCSIAVILAAGAVLVFAEIPLTGEPEFRHMTAPEQARPAQSPGYVVNRTALTYVLDASQKPIEGTVVVELAFNAKGEIVDSHVLSGREELRQAALQTALQGKYPIDVARNLQVVVEFKAPIPGQRSAGPLAPAGARGGRGAGPTGPLPIQDPNNPTRVRVGPRIAANNLLTQVAAIKPARAQEIQLSGVVMLEADISKDGVVTDLRVVTGHPLLVEPAIDAVKQWKYKPIALNGQPVDVVTTVAVEFP
jgi:TonB family protein